MSGTMALNSATQTETYTKSA